MNTRDFIFKSTETQATDDLGQMVSNAMHFAQNRIKEGYQIERIEGPYLSDEEMIFIVKGKSESE